MNSGRHYKRRSQLSKQSSRPQPRPRFFLLRMRWLVLLLLLVPAMSYTIAVDVDVRKQFEGRRWALPARVYARPLELYQGMEISRKDLMNELDASGYNKVSKLAEPGEYFQKGRDLYVYTRTFQFWDIPEPARQLRIRFRGNKILSIVALQQGAQLAILRLDPALIGKIYPTHKEDRMLVNLQEVPEMLIKALMAMEDRDFYEHNGISLRALGRATLANIKAGAWVQGGSTLTQQLIKNHYLTPERTLKRKINEALMSLLLEWHYEKDAILQAYLNEVYLGQHGDHAIHGVGMASWFYFKRPLQKLALHEMALLVGLVRGASRYNPRRYPERAKKRRALVLKVMYEQGLISAVQYEEGKVEPLNVTDNPPKSQSPYPAFLDLVRRQLQEDYREEDLRSEGLQIFTTLDPIMQHQAEQSVIKRVKLLEKENRKQRNKLNGSLVVTSAENGEVLALVGDKRPRYQGFNRALDAVRPIGSLVKPAIYLTALENSRSYSLLSPLQDKAFKWTNTQTGEIWEPRNYTNKEHGQVALFEALANSYNLATVHLGFELGLDKVRQTLIRMGVERDFKAYPSMLLGGLSLTPYEVTQIYQTLASGGFRVPLRAIRNVLTHDGKPLNRYALSVEQRFDSAPVFLLNYALEQALRGGTGKSTAKALLPQKLRLVGKTGTTNNYRDSWFAGYGSNLLAVAWVGRDDNRSTMLSGGNGAMKVWADFMSEALPHPVSSKLPKRVQWQSVQAQRGSLTQNRGYVKMPVIVNHSTSKLAYSAMAVN